MSARNTLKTAILLATLTGLIAVVGHAFGGRMGTIIALGFALVVNGAAYWCSDRIALAMAGARPVPRSEAPMLYQRVEELAALARVPMPQVYLIEEASPNAFATGRDPGHAAIAVTTGLMAWLNADELSGANHASHGDHSAKVRSSGMRGRRW